MKLQEIRDLSSEELVRLKRTLLESSFHLRIQQQSGQLEKPSELRLIRRRVARVSTVINEKIRTAALAYK